MRREYITKRDGEYYVAGTRVTLASIVHEFLDGASPETIVEDFDSLRLEQVYGAIAYYLANQAQIDAHVAQRARNYEKARRRQPPLNPVLRERLNRARRRLARLA